jgi:hypothetical protein
VPIGIDGEVSPGEITDAMDIVWIYPVMPLGVEQKVNGRAFKIEQMRARGVKNATTKEALDVGAYDAAVLELNILHWQGPGFTDPRTGRPIACTPQTIAALNSQEPIIRRVRQEITDRNRKAEAADVVATDEGDDVRDAGEGEMLELPKYTSAR